MKCFHFTIILGILSCWNVGFAQVFPLPEESFGVWDRSGGHDRNIYPYLKGEGIRTDWKTINPAKHVYDWSVIDSALNFADSINQMIYIKIQPINGSSQSVPPWLFTSGVPLVTHPGSPGWQYGYYLDPDYIDAFHKMIEALGHHFRNEISEDLQNRIAFIRVDTGATGDEVPWDSGFDTPDNPAYAISPTQWRDFRLAVFEKFDNTFQEGTGKNFSLIFNSVNQDSYPVEHAWLTSNITSGLGFKTSGAHVRGHHLTFERSKRDLLVPYLIDPAGLAAFSMNEMDQTWKKSYYQLNVRLGFYWGAINGLHLGLGIWDVTKSALENSTAGGWQFAFEFFNKYAGEVISSKAKRGFCVLHDGLDSSDTQRFPEATYGSASKGNEARYNAITAAFASRGARMDHPFAATKGQVWQRSNQNGFNDSGWEIIAGNYERFIHQIDPNDTSIGLFRVGMTDGFIPTDAPIYCRFARSFEHASGKNAMYFDIEDNFFQGVPLNGQYGMELRIRYYDEGFGSWEMQYDAVGNPQKTAIIVNKSNSRTWKEVRVEIADAYFGNRSVRGADFMFLNKDSDDDIFHIIEMERTTINSQSEIRLNKTTEPLVTSLTDGDIVQYRIDYSNPSDQAAINVRITDPIPLNTTYVPGSMKLSGVGTLTDESGDDAGYYNDTLPENQKQVEFSIPGSVAPNATGSVYFSVHLQIKLKSYELTNTAYVTADNIALTSATVIVPVTESGSKLLPRALLQGALWKNENTLLMRDDLRKNNLLPAVEPYSALTSFTHIGGGGNERVADTNTVFADRGNESVVDWIFIELRQSDNKSLVLHTQSGLLLRDGKIVDIDGVSPLHFPSAAPASYYVAVRHRNHLGMMTAQPLSLNGTSQTVDFTDANTEVWDNGSILYSDGAGVNINGSRALWGGNAYDDDKLIFTGENNESIRIFDLVLLHPENQLRSFSFIASGYYTEDTTMDGRVLYSGNDSDTLIYFDNVRVNHPGNSVGDYTFIIREQLP